ncbi:hypothetical protein pah_c205o071 [Parachlamydia acanthamoebae str. Hall's coccus]|nr:hypothetical protein pah_c205o071 [Parachlamydia acanthamoebae str. Hall's coccus]
MIRILLFPFFSNAKVSAKIGGAKTVFFSFLTFILITDIAILFLPKICESCTLEKVCKRLNKKLLILIRGK